MPVAGAKELATAARGFVASRVAGRPDLVIPGGGGTEEWVGTGLRTRDGTGTLPVAGEFGVGPACPPIFWRRDFRSIFGFLSSAIVEST
jgi:hypothetical protein